MTVIRDLYSELAHRWRVSRNVAKLRAYWSMYGWPKDYEDVVHRVAARLQERADTARWWLDLGVEDSMEEAKRRAEEVLP